MLQGPGSPHPRLRRPWFWPSQRHRPSPALAEQSTGPRSPRNVLHTALRAPAPARAALGGLRSPGHVAASCTVVPMSTRCALARDSRPGSVLGVQARPSRRCVVEPGRPHNPPAQGPRCRVGPVTGLWRIPGSFRWESACRQWSRVSLGYQPLVVWTCPIASGASVVRPRAFPVSSRGPRDRAVCRVAGSGGSARHRGRCGGGFNRGGHGAVAAVAVGSQRGEDNRRVGRLWRLRDGHSIGS